MKAVSSGCTGLPLAARELAAGFLCHAATFFAHLADEANSILRHVHHDTNADHAHQGNHGSANHLNDVQHIVSAQRSQRNGSRRITFNACPVKLKDQLPSQRTMSLTVFRQDESTRLNVR